MLVFYFLTFSVKRTHFTVLVMPEVRKDMGDPNTGETSPEGTSDEEQMGTELQEIVPSATVSGEIRQPPPDDSSNLSFEEAMQRRRLPLQRSWDSVSSGSHQPEEQALEDTAEYSFKNSKIKLRRGSSSKSPEEENDAARLGDSMTELSARSGPSGCCDQKENESPATKMLEKCSKAVGELASEIESSKRSSVKSPLSEQNTSASLEDGKESDAAMEVASSESFQPEVFSPLSDSTEYSFSSTKLVIRKRSSSTISPEKKTSETRVEDSLTELSSTPGPSGYCGENVQKQESPVTKAMEKFAKAAEAVTSEVKSSLMSCFRPPLSEQSSSASLADVSENESVSTMEVVSPESLQQDDPLSDSTEYSFSNTKLELQRGSPSSPENETDDSKVVDSTTELSSTPGPSGYCGENVQIQESPVTKAMEKCAKAAEAVTSEVKSSLMSCFRPPLSEQSSSASLADVSENESVSTMEVVSPDSLQQDDPLSDNTEYSFSNTKLELQRGPPSSPENETDDSKVVDSTTEMSSKPEPSDYCDKIKEEKEETSMTKMVEKCSEALGEFASGISSSLISCTRPPLSEQNSSASLADMSGNECDSTMEIEFSGIQSDDPMSDSMKSENSKSAFQRGSTSESPEEKTGAGAVEDSINELSGSPGSSGYCDKGQKKESLLEKMVEKCSKAAEEMVSGIKSLASGTKPPPLSEQQSSSSFADESENESDSSTEVARKYRKLLNERKVCIAQSAPGSQEQTRTRRKQFRRQANVEEGVEMDTIAIDSSGLAQKPETTTHETQTDTAKEIFYRNLCLLSDSDFSTSKETENDETEDTTDGD